MHNKNHKISKYVLNDTTIMKFERKPIQPNPTCAMCGKPIKEHTLEEIKNCMEQRRNSKLQ